MKEVEFKLSDELSFKFAHVNISAVQVYQTEDGNYFIEYDENIPDELIDAVQDYIIDSMKPKKVKKPRQKKGRKVMIPCRKYR